MLDNTYNAFDDSQVEDLSVEFEQPKTEYEVWAIGYDRDERIMDTELLLSTFADPDAAVAYAKSLTLADIVQAASEADTGIEPDHDISYLRVEVETVVDAEDEGTMNVGTIFHKDVPIDNEPANEIELSTFVPVTAGDYRLREDGCLIVDNHLLNGYEVGDLVRICFKYEPIENPILTYKVLSKSEHSGHSVLEFYY